MIILTRLGGHALAVNPDLIERAEATPDTVITLVDGHKLVVSESVEELVGRIRSWRAGIAAAAYRAVTDAERIRDGVDPLSAPGAAEGGPGEDDAGDAAADHDSAQSAARRAHRTERLAVVAGLGRVLPIARKEG